MLMKLFILAVGIIGVATKPSRRITAIQAFLGTMDETCGKSVVENSVIWRAGVINCTEPTFINRKLTVDTTNPMNNTCEVCICGAPIGADPPSKNCDRVPCFTDGVVDVSVQESWDDTYDLSVWPGICDAVPFQVYKVDDGFCYTYTDNVKTLKCFAHPPLDSPVTPSSSPLELLSMIGSQVEHWNRVFNDILRLRMRQLWN